VLTKIPALPRAGSRSAARSDIDPRETACQTASQQVSWSAVRSSDDAPELTAALAERLLDGRPLSAPIAGSITEMKALRDRCLAAGIPALVGCPPGAGKG